MYASLGRFARPIFKQHNGEGPWPCFFCDRPVRAIVQYYGVVHHKDHDETNNSPENLVAAHHGCHTRHHRTGKLFSEESRAKCRASAAHQHTLDHRAALSAANRTRRQCECGYESNPGTMGSHIKKTGHQVRSAL